MENKGFYINDLPQSGEVTFLAAVIEKELRPKRNGGSCLSVRLADRSGELDAKAWDNPETVAQLFDCNDVVKVRGAMEQYNDKPQLIVSRIRRCEAQERQSAIPRRCSASWSRLSRWCATSPFDNYWSRSSTTFRSARGSRQRRRR